MSDAYDPRQEFPATRIIGAGLLLVLLGFGTVAFIIWGKSDGDAPAAAAAAPAEAAPSEMKAQ